MKSLRSSRRGMTVIASRRPCCNLYYLHRASAHVAGSAFASGLGLDLEPAVGRAQAHAEEAQEAFLSEEVEGERPRIAEADRSVVADAGDREHGAAVPRGGR